MAYIKKPETIESKSFEIIGEEMGNKVQQFSEEELMIVKRVIHTTADFEYADLIEIHPKAIEVAKKVLQEKSSIYADTSMIVSGVNKRKLKELEVDIYNFVHDTDVFETAKAEGITRSMAGIRKAVHTKDIQIFLIGNAPTAIFQLKELIESGAEKPALIIGVPVGFVGAAESKEILEELGVPYIRVNGRKGGSAVAAAIINAILKMIERKV